MAEKYQAANPKEQAEVESGYAAQSAWKNLGSWNRNPGRESNRYILGRAGLGWVGNIIHPRSGLRYWYQKWTKPNRERRAIEEKIGWALIRTVGVATGIYKKYQVNIWDPKTGDYKVRSRYFFRPSIALGSFERKIGQRLSENYDVHWNPNLHDKIEGLGVKGWDVLTREEKKGFWAGIARARYHNTIDKSDALKARLLRRRYISRNKYEADGSFMPIWVMKFFFDLGFTILRSAARYAIELGVETVPGARALRQSIKNVSWSKFEDPLITKRFYNVFRSARLGYKLTNFGFKAAPAGLVSGGVVYFLTLNPYATLAFGGLAYGAKFYSYLLEWNIQKGNANRYILSGRAGRFLRAPGVGNARLNWIQVRAADKSLINIFKPPVYGPTIAFIIGWGAFGLPGAIVAAGGTATVQLAWGTREWWWQALKGRNIGWVVKVDNFFTVGGGSWIPGVFKFIGKIPATVFQLVNPGSLITAVIVSKLGLPFFHGIIPMPWAPLLSQIPVVGPILSMLPILGWLPVPGIGLLITGAAGWAWHYLLSGGGAKLTSLLTKFGVSKLAAGRILTFFQGINTGFWVYSAGEFAEFLLASFGIHIPIIGSWLGEILGGGYFAWRVGPTIIRIVGPFAWQQFGYPTLFRAIAWTSNILSGITLAGLASFGVGVLFVSVVISGTLVISGAIAAILTLIGSYHDPQGSSLRGGTLDSPNIRLEKLVSTPEIPSARTINISNESVDDGNKVDLTYKITVTNISDVAREIVYCEEIFKVTGTNDELPGSIQGGDYMTSGSGCNYGEGVIEPNEDRVFSREYQIPPTGYVQYFKDAVLTNVFMICLIPVDSNAPCDAVEEGQNVNRASTIASVIIGEPPSLPPCGWPTTGQLTQLFGGGHGGVDLGTSNTYDLEHGQPVYATMTGTIYSKSWDGPADGSLPANNGGIIDVLGGTSEPQYLTHYVHLTKNTIDSWAVGAIVVVGQLIGMTQPDNAPPFFDNNLTNSTQTHLHYSVKSNGEWQNPLDYTPSEGQDDPIDLYDSVIVGGCYWIPRQ